MNNSFLIIFAYTVLLISIPSAFASEGIFYGTSSIERLPSALVPDSSQIIEIKFQYQDGPYSLSDFKPIFYVCPKDAAPYVRINFEPLEGVVRNSIKRMLGTITVDPEIPSEKIFLNVSYVGTYSIVPPVPFKSGWSDSAIIDIRENLAGGSLDDTLHSDDPASNYEIISLDDFEYEFQDDAAIFTKDMTGISILETGIQYYVVQKAEFRESSFGDKDTRVNATIGCAIQPGDQILRPTMHENATDAEHEEFMMKIQEQQQEFPQQSPIGDSYDFVVDIENPFYIKFPFVIEESGQYTRQFYKNTHIFEGPSSSGMGGLVAVEKFSKAVDENGVCKNDNFRRLIKHDYSTVACVGSQTAWQLIGRGWGL